MFVEMFVPVFILFSLLFFTHRIHLNEEDQSLFSSSTKISRCPPMNSSLPKEKIFFQSGQTCLEMNEYFYPGLISPLKIFVRRGDRLFKRMKEELNRTGCFQENQIDLQFWKNDEEEDETRRREEGFFILIDVIEEKKEKIDYQIVLPTSSREDFRRTVKRSRAERRFLLRHQNPSEERVNVSLLSCLVEDD